MNAAIFFEPDGYVLDGPRLMGRQAAGNGFLRAAVKGRNGDEPLVAYTPSRASANAFRMLVQQFDPTAQTQWLPANRLERIGQLGVLYRPDHAISVSARARLRVGIDSYSICGVTHTLASSASTEVIADYLTAPLAPWDAVICTSQGALGVMEATLAAEADYLAWRFGRRLDVAKPQMPVIPLGVHCDDFAVSERDRAAARAALALADDEVVALFAGRLAFSAKAHPYAMLVSLQAAAERTGRKVVLIQAGQFPNPAIERVFRTAADQFCPDVRAVFVDGSDTVRYRQAWAGSDIFMSLSDSIQETFGLTPVEAMAAGLPVVVSDWNGYKDTVRDGVDGFRIPTWAPEPGAGQRMARDHEVGTNGYEFYLSRTSTMVAVEMPPLVERLAALITHPDLRREMGAAGRARAREMFDWSVVFRQYQALWAELSALRLGARDEARTGWLAAAPKAAASSLDPFSLFGHYASAWISLATHVTRRPGATVERYQELVAHQLWSHWKSEPPQIAQVLDLLGEGTSVARIAEGAKLSADEAIELVGRLAKMDLVALSNGGAREPQ